MFLMPQLASLHDKRAPTPLFYRGTVTATWFNTFLMVAFKKYKQASVFLPQYHSEHWCSQTFLQRSHSTVELSQAVLE